ncbi:hypothetical protein [Metallosphaera hakonensis]|uniref:Uncharacterized protein n=1 Tax=Metallosphaera hakonensis JCM 8857 = DSM 7519 TaxID=1293036 RepID=A0A2U9IWQ7_9CREN|nr:hypothetical protein [Metallosphaera hakonensis]AWS00455.1 hypothetical protein DFR87_00185 [Metallosphaera hakonensis JCM 8857 = DSM 7519]
MRKGISVPIFMVLMFILLVAVLVPAYLLFSSTQIYSNQGSQQATGYLEGQSQEVNQVFRGNPNVYYNSSKTPYLQVLFTSIPYPLNLTQIYYFNGTSWDPILKSSLVVAGNTFIPLPSKAFNKPVIMVSGEGNVYFLNPNTSINTVNVQGPAGKFPVYIASFVENGSSYIPVSVSVLFPSSSSSALTPSVYYVLPGTYPLTDVDNTTFLPQYGITGVFQNWSIVGGTLSNTNQLSTSVTVFAPTVITAIYKAQTNKYTVTIKPRNLPLAPNTTTENSRGSITLTSLNSTIPVKIDNKTYEISSNGTELNLTYGYHIVQFPAQYNITFNYSTFNYSFSSNGGHPKFSSQFSAPAGEINCYILTNLFSNTSNISIAGPNEIFVKGPGMVYGNYSLGDVYYASIVSNYFFLPKGATLDKNSTPILGNIAGQLIQVNNTFVIGPIDNYHNQILYFKNGTILLFTYQYLTGITGDFTINGQVYSQLLSCPVNITAIYPIGNKVNIVAYHPEQLGSITIDSPIYIIDYQEWSYGGVAL